MEMGVKSNVYLLCKQRVHRGKKASFICIFGWSES